MNKYQVGDCVRCTVEFRDLNGALADPTGVTMRYRNGTGATTVKTYGTDAEVVKQSTGIYYIDITPDAAGTWHWAGRGTGAVVGAYEGSFSVTTNF